jgi:hypothetical protein
MTNVSWNISDWEEETFFYQTVGAAFRSNCLPAQLFPSARPHSNLFITPKQVDEVQVERRGKQEEARRRGVTSRRRQKRGKSRDDVFLYILALKNKKSN